MQCLIIYLLLQTKIARVAELVDALDSKSSFFGSAGSIPASSTYKPINNRILIIYRFIVLFSKNISIQLQLLR